MIKCLLPTQYKNKFNKENYKYPPLVDRLNLYFTRMEESSFILFLCKFKSLISYII